MANAPYDWDLIVGWVAYAQKLCHEAPHRVAPSIITDLSSMTALTNSQMDNYTKKMSRHYPGLLPRRGWLWVLCCTLGYDLTFVIVRDYPINHPVTNVLFSETQIN